MSEKYSFIVSLKSILPEETWPWVIPALRKDPLVWKSLQYQKFGQQALLKIGPNPEDWTPASLALLALDQDPRASSKPLEVELQQEAAQTLKESLANHDQPGSESMTLAKSGLLAIALYILREEEGSWKGIPDALQRLAGITWETPIACLYGLAEDRVELLQTLLHADSGNKLYGLAVHAILSTPLPVQEHAKTLHSVLKTLPLSLCIGVLEHLKKYRPNFAIDLARLFLERTPATSHPQSFSKYADALKQILRYLQNAHVHEIANLPSQAASLRIFALEIIKKLHANIAAQLAYTSAEGGNIEAALAHWQGSEDISLNSDSLVQKQPPIDLILALLQAGHFEDATALIEDHHEGDLSDLSWLYHLTCAHQSASHGSLKQAKEQALRALSGMKSQVNQLSETHDTGASSEDRPMIAAILNLARLLVEISMLQEAIQTYEIALDFKPDAPELLVEKGRAQRKTGDVVAATTSSHLAVAIDPSNGYFRRELIANLEAAKDWQAAFQERTILLEERFCEKNSDEWPAEEDLRNLAICALKSGRAERSIEICRQLLDSDYSDSLARATLGEALATTGKLEAGLEHLQKATQLAPYQSAPWLALARVRRAAGENAKAIETLRTASNAIPDDGAIYFALAEAYLDENSLTQALSVLRRAHEICSTTRQQDRNDDLAVKIGLRLGQTLTRLGHVDEAAQILEQGYESRPAYPEMAYAYAQALLCLDKHEAALDPLLIAVQEKPEDPETYISYARALLAVESQPEEAIKVLQTAMRFTKNEDRITKSTSQGLMAEALAASGDLNAALQAYYHALDAVPSGDSTWCSRLYFGLGSVALELDKRDVAVANLQEAAQLDPGNAKIQQALSKAFAASQLNSEALAAARNARELAPDDLEMLSWFATQALSYDVQSEAVTALQEAVQIDPTRTDLLVCLAQIHAESGETEPALDRLRSILKLENLDPENAYQAALLMLQLGDPSSAATCLEQVNKRSSVRDVELLYTLARAYYQSGDVKRSLDTLDNAIRLNPSNLSLYTLKASLLETMSQFAAAKETLERALDIHPGEPVLVFNIAQILRKNGQLTEALQSAERVISAYKATPFDPLALKARAMGAELARALLKINHARSLLSIDADQEEQDEIQPQREPVLTTQSNQLEQARFESPDGVSFHCLAAEMALEQDEEIAAAASLTRAFELVPEHPRVMALQARLTLRRGDEATAVQILQTALEAIGRENKSTSSQEPSVKTGSTEVGACTAVAAAAVEFKQWDVGLYLIRKAINKTPREAFLHVQLARTLVLRAEFKRLCEELDVATHSPEQAACSGQALNSLEEALHNARSYVYEFEPELEDEPLLIRRWRARGKAVFNPDQASLLALEDLPEKTPSDYAARIALMRRLGDMASIAEIYKQSVEGSKPLPKHHQVLAQLALSLGYNGRRQDDLEEAIKAARTCIDQQPGQPLYHILLAVLAERQGDIEVALRSAQTALSLWPEEPHWQVMTAKLHLKSGDAPAAIVHLKKATQLEPHHLAHYLLLGEAYLKHEEIQQAIRIFERAHQIDPASIKPCLSLAKAYLLGSELSRAAQWADIALDRGENQFEPLLLRAEIALKAKNLKEALNHSRMALGLQPNNASALRLHAQILNALGRPEEALEVMERAIPLTENPIHLRLARVELIENSQGSAAALEALLELANHYPEEAAVLAPLSTALAESGRKEEAVRAAQLALRTDQLSSGQRAYLLFMLGNILRQTGQLDQAIYNLGEAIRLDPTNVEAYLALGATHRDRREHLQALETYQRAIQVAPENPKPYYQAGLLLKESRDYQGAEDMLRRAAQIAQDDLDIHRQLGAIVALNLVHNPRTLTIDL